MLKLLTSIVALTLISVACNPALTPAEVNGTLPTLVYSKYFTKPQADEAVNSQRCKYLVTERKYIVPPAISPYQELANGAQGIEEWINVDGGNAFALVNYNWVTIPGGDNNTTQLHLTFDTMICVD